MGNVVSPCLSTKCSLSVKLIVYRGTTRILIGKHIAREILFESLPDKVIVCHADSFFMGRPIPILAIDDELLPGKTYFVLPFNLFPINRVLSASTLAALLKSSMFLSSSSSDPNNKNNVPIKHICDPFEYIKGVNGKVSIKVVPEYITRLINGGDDEEDQDGNGDDTNFLCNTPELKRHYELLVGRSRKQIWSPKLETISECNKTNCSPCKFIGRMQKVRAE